MVWTCLPSRKHFNIAKNIALEERYISMLDKTATISCFCLAHGGSERLSHDFIMMHVKEMMSMHVQMPPEIYFPSLLYALFRIAPPAAMYFSKF